MLMFKKHVLVAFGATCLVAGAAHAQDGANARDGIDPSGQTVTAAAQPDGSSEQMRMDQMAMQQMMKSQKLMTAAKEKLMSDDKMAERVAREILMQEMVLDKKYLAMVRDGLRTDTDNEPKMKVLVDKISSAKSKLMKDKDALMSMTQELMVRQLAANRIAMINGGRFNSEATEATKDKTTNDKKMKGKKGKDRKANDIRLKDTGTDQPAVANKPVGGK